jgi:hypothetical protein
LKVWDELNLKRKVVGIGGCDAHAHKYNLLGFMEVEIFPYKVLFKAIRTHILLKNELTRDTSEKAIQQSKKIINNTLADGKCFFANDYQADSKGFRFFAEADDKIYHMGDYIKSAKKIKLRVLLPVQEADMRLIRNGREIAKTVDKSAEFIIEENGAYRVEVYIHNKAWIYTNHIRIGI